MMWPTPQDYNEAVQNPITNFGDPNLKRGTLAVTRLGLPVVASGSFASVYRVACGEQKFAVRCFLKNVPNQQVRYERISEYVMTDDLPYTVSFHYLPQGIFVKGNWFPLLKMDWVYGMTLDTYVRQHLGHPEKIRDICMKFKQMMLDLQQAGIAHGDLQHGNIMVTPEDELRLVDYDGMYVPALSGFESAELGHRNYQHPARDQTNFNERVDNFSAWSIFTSLEILQADPSLAQRVGACDECLLFRQQDYRYPLSSPVFSLLEEHQNADIRMSAQTLRGLLSTPLERTPFLSESVTVPSNLAPLQKGAPSLPPYVIPPKTIQEEPETGHFWASLREYINAASNPRRSFVDPHMQSYVLALDHGSVRAEGTEHGALFTFHRPNETTAMVKFFLKGDQFVAQRYQLLHAHLHGQAPDYAALQRHFVKFAVIPEGVRVHNKYYTIIRMDHLKLRTLFEAVEEDRTDRLRMRTYMKQFIELMRVLESNNVVHGDIEPQNIMVDNDRLMLVDYDLTTTPVSRPLASPLLGNKHYQHPGITIGGPEVNDNFSAWIMYYSLKLLDLYPALWNIAGARPGRLLFHADDLHNPGNSELFSMLQSHFNEEVREIATQIEEMCHMAPTAVPPLTDAHMGAFDFGGVPAVQKRTGHGATAFGKSLAIMRMSDFRRYFALPIVGVLASLILIGLVLQNPIIALGSIFALVAFLYALFSS